MYKQIRFKLLLAKVFLVRTGRGFVSLNLFRRLLKAYGVLNAFNVLRFIVQIHGLNRLSARSAWQQVSGPIYRAIPYTFFIFGLGLT